jgi:cell division septum initiation protein DivIVA
MTYAPVEIAHIKLPKGMFGYKKAAVDEALEEIRLSFEDVWRERADLHDKVESLEADIVRYKELETLLRTTLISAERASQQLVDQARREAEVSLEEAHAEARRVTRAALEERERLLADSTRIRLALAAALQTMTQGEADAQVLGQERAAAAAQPQAHAPQPTADRPAGDRPAAPVPTPRPGQSAAA